MTRSRPMRDFALAMGLLTIVPTGVRWPEREQVDIAGWFPLVGAVLGAIGAAIIALSWRLGVQGVRLLVVAALVMAAWALLTRFLHWDGLADVSDALWGGHTPERRLDIMSDSSTGAFGATAIALVALVGVASLASLAAAGEYRVVFVAPLLARFAATFAAWVGKPARPGGLGRSVMGRPGIGGVIAALVGLAIAGAVMWTAAGALGVVFVVALVALALVVPHVLSLPVGGVTGDIMGASVLVCEALGLAAGALVWGL